MENPLVPEGEMATCTEKTGKAAPLRQAAPGEARRTNGPKRTSSRGSANA
jgi:hypothetical protein